MRGRWWRWLRVIVAVGLILSFGAFVTGWLMFQHIPSWYEPVAIPFGDLQLIRDDFVATLDGLRGAMASSDGPFEYAFTQDQINAWLTAREQMWPLSREWLPPEMSDPFVMIEEGAGRLAATFQQGGVKTVVNARIELSADAQAVAVRLVEVAGGSLGVPEAWIRDELARLDGGVWPAGKRAQYQLSPTCLPALSDLFDGVVFPNRWEWNNPRRPFRITGLKLVPGRIVVTFDPEPLYSDNS